MPSASPACSPRVHDVETLNIDCYQEVKESMISESPTESAATASSLSTSHNSDTTDSSTSPSKLNSSSESPTFRQRLRSARMLIPQYPAGRARLTFSTGDSEQISKDETSVKPKTQRSDDFRSFFREHYIVTEL
jgi:hypothetical protein